MPNDARTAANDGARRAWIGVGAPILGLVLVIIMLAVATFSSFARDQDRAFAETSGKLVVGALDGRARSLGSVTLDYANWDDAFHAISERWDAEWVAGNFYSSAADGMILFRADGSVRYSWFNPALQGQGAALTPTAVRAAIDVPTLRHLARAPAPAGAVARTYARLNDQLVLVALAPITHEDAAARLAHNPVSGYDYLALVDLVTAEELAEIAAALDLRDVRFLAPGAGGASKETVALPLIAADGENAGRLQWRHVHPGSASFQRQVWPVIFGLLAIGALAVLIARLLVARQIGAMAHAEAALESSRLKSDFLTRVGHELRTPLNAIIGYAEIIQEENESKETHADADRIIVAARHLNHLLNDIFDQSRIDAGGIKLQLEVLPVAGFLAEVQGLLRPAAKSAGVTLTASSSAMANYMVADHVRLRQCMLNLAGNAIKFSPRGAVEIKARVETSNGREMVVFDIVDTGIGIAKSDLDNLFRPFAQANPSINKTFGGAGLGLSISRDLARAMGGDITVISEFGKGSTFSLSVPVATARALKAA